MAFWDASAIVPLCCSQPASAPGRQLRRELKRMVVWWGTPLEARSAFARLVRDADISPDDRVAAVKLLGQLRVTWDEILPTEQLRSLAEELPDAHRLRAADTAQLAAALVWCRGRPKQRPFVCFDERLSTAASALGFSVRP
ncbi:MAG: type II toxin-antitoxin system VapC family toxin [Acidimicrobiia bacterium]|nr:type II toxin-antitoxin system VapC family toxin [Acidimicrobiia bacterium]